jgi:hypothetical protein
VPLRDPANLNLKFEYNPNLNFRAVCRADPKASYCRAVRGLPSGTSIIRVGYYQLYVNSARKSAQPSAAAARATISSNPDGSVASAAARAVQPSAPAFAGARRSRASATAMSASSRCTPAAFSTVVRACVGGSDLIGRCSCAEAEQGRSKGGQAFQRHSAFGGILVLLVLREISFALLRSGTCMPRQSSA